MKAITYNEAWDIFNDLRKRVIETIQHLVGDADVELEEMYCFNEMTDVDCTDNYVIRHFTRNTIFAEDNEHNIGEVVERKWDDLQTQDLIHILRNLQEGKMTDYVPDED